MIVSSGMYIEGTGYDRVFRYVYRRYWLGMIVSSGMYIEGTGYGRVFRYVYRRYWLWSCLQVCI